MPLLRSHLAAANLNINGSGTNKITSGSGGVWDGTNRAYSFGNKVPVAGISATGTADATTYLRGDGTWATPAGGSAPANMVTTDTSQDISGNKTFTGTLLTFSPAGTTGSVRFGDDVGRGFMRLQNDTAPGVAGSVLGRFFYRGTNSGSTATNYIEMRGILSDPTAASEDAYLTFYSMIGGTNKETVRIGDNNYAVNAFGDITATGTIGSIPPAGSGYVQMNPGSTSRSGYIHFFSPQGNRQAYIGWSPTNTTGDTGTLEYRAGTHDFSGTITQGGLSVSLSNHGHDLSGYSTTSHTHPYAATSHTHSYVALSGDTMSGNLTFNSTARRIIFADTSQQIGWSAAAEIGVYGSTGAYINFRCNTIFRTNEGTNSSQDFKKNIRAATADNAPVLEDILGLKLVRFKYKNAIEPEDVEHTGVIFEETNNKFHYKGRGAEDNEMARKSINTLEIQWGLVASVQTLHKRLAAAEAEIAKLTKKAS